MCVRVNDIYICIYTYICKYELIHIHACVRRSSRYRVHWANVHQLWIHAYIHISDPIESLSISIRTVSRYICVYICVAMCCRVLQCVAVCYQSEQSVCTYVYTYVLQGVAGCCRVLSIRTVSVNIYVYNCVCICVPACHSVLQRVAMCCRVLQCVINQNSLCVHMCLHTHVNVYTHTYIYIHTHIYEYIYVCVYIYLSGTRLQ